MNRIMDRRSFVAAALGCVALFGLAGCEGKNGADDQGVSAGTGLQGEISVYSREDGSGTRGAFVELMGIEQKDENGNKVDMTTITAAITNSTSVMMATVASDARAIGYISLGSLNETVKALMIDGVPATADNVKDGSYAVARPFNIVTVGTVGDLAADFIAFIMSAQGQTVVEENGYVAAASNAAEYKAAGPEGKLVVAGSSSVAPVMEKLAEAYEALNGGVNIEVQTSDSTTGVNWAIEGTCDIGMASRNIKDSELEKGAEPLAIALDGIAVIVHPESPVNGLTSEQVCAIYTGEVETWEDALAL